MSDQIQQAEASLRTFALSLPEAQEEFPWGERVIKVNKKIFVFLGVIEDRGTWLRVGIKLPSSAEAALSFPFAVPTGYGLGKHGWVSTRFGAEDEPPVDLLQDWIEESYRAIAPKRLVALLDQT